VGRRGDTLLAIVAFVAADLLSRLAKVATDAPRPTLAEPPPVSIGTVPEGIVILALGALLVSCVVPMWRRHSLLFALGITLAVVPVAAMAWTIPLVRGFDGFPSGHATASMAAGLIAVIVSWPTRFRAAVVITSVIVIGGVGLSRVYLEAHYPADVVAGWCLGVAPVGATWFLGHRWLIPRLDGYLRLQSPPV